MKEKVKVFAARMEAAVRRNPVEVFLSVLFCMLGFVQYEYGKEEIIYSLRGVLIYFPVFFLFSYLLNYGTRTGKFRWVYYLSTFSFLPFFWIYLTDSAAYWVSLIVVQLLYLAVSGRKENESFTRNALGYFRALLFGGVLATVAWLFMLSIYYSIRYIFEIFTEEEGRFVSYSLSVAYLLFFPLLFLMFKQEEGAVKAKGNRLFEVLLNYVLSPVLLVYALILYAYFIKVVVLWSLPKGVLAYIVISFVSAAFLLRGCQPLLKRRYYDWFYKYASWYVVPALAMFWVGTFYRIGQYGYTQDRVYLVLLGCVLTVCTGLFFSRRWGRYLYVAWFGVFLLSVFTYIPGISAEDLGLCSQERRFVKAAEALRLFTAGGKLSTSGNVATDEAAKDYHVLYESFRYLDKMDKKEDWEAKYGVRSPQFLLDSVVPFRLRNYAEYGNDYGRYWYHSVFLRGRKAEMDIAGFRTMYPVNNQVFRQVRGGRDVVITDRNGTVYFKENMDSLFNGILNRAGIPSLEGVTGDTLLRHENELLYYDRDSVRLIIREIELADRVPLELKSMEVDFLLVK